MNKISLLNIIRQKNINNTNEFHNSNFYYVSEKISVEELSVILGKNAGEIIFFFHKQGKNITKNQCLPWNWLESYCQSLGIKLKKKLSVSFNEIIKKYLTEIDKNSPLSERSPTIGIMGHIDHGKTTLLDTICHTHLQEKEVGGITQKITAFQVELEGKKVTFLDTPGHNDFVRIRQRGISLIDLVFLVIAGEEGVMSQTEEIINYLLNYKLPVIVFVNHKKLDKISNEINLNRIKTQLQEKGLTPLDWVAGSAKKKESVNSLCEDILLLDDYKVNWQCPASGAVINSYLHPRSKTILFELLVQRGILQEGDEVFLNGNFGQVKIISDWEGHEVKQAVPGDLIKVVGFNFLAELGDTFLVIRDKKEREDIKEELSGYQTKNDNTVSSYPADEKKNINLVLLADSQNSLEVLSEVIEKNQVPNVNFTIIYTAVRKLNSFAIRLAKISRSLILVFGYQLSLTETKILRENQLSFFSSKIIYEITNKLREIAKSQKEKKQVEKERGVAKVIRTFYFSRIGSIAGCLVVKNKISRNDLVRVFREEKKIFTGKIKSLESKNKRELEVINGQECGLVLEGFNDFKVGDKVMAFQVFEEDVV